MKITNIRLGMLRVPLKTPFKTALRTVETVEDIVVVMETDDGRVGYGEAPATAQDALRSYGAALGLAFQVVDDILDVTQDSATLGKTAGKDAAQSKPTYVSLMGLDGARAHADDLLAQALASLDASHLHDTQALRALAVMVVQRSS